MGVGSPGFSKIGFGIVEQRNYEYAYFIGMTEDPFCSCRVICDERRLVPPTPKVLCLCFFWLGQVTHTRRGLAPYPEAAVDLPVQIRKHGFKILLMVTAEVMVAQ